MSDELQVAAQNENELALILPALVLRYQQKSSDDEDAYFYQVLYDLMSDEIIRTQYSKLKDILIQIAIKLAYKSTQEHLQRLVDMILWLDTKGGSILNILSSLYKNTMY